MLFRENKTFIIILILCVFLLYSFLFFSCAAEEIKDELKVSIDLLLNEKRFIVQTESCTVSLTLFDTDINRGIIKYRNPCNFDPQRDIPIFKVLLTAVLDDNRTDSLRTLSWGRLTPALNKHSILGRRLAVAASKSEMWDKQVGKSHEMGENNFVRDLLNRENIFKEVKDIFRKFDIEMQVVNVEKVLVYNAEELPDFDFFQRHEIEKHDQIPIDCQIWIGLKH